ncbi:hypothetical protein [Bradyrhizobium sp. NBAIM08]|uniref:hypothetical protein n=1 Tax=Bradyrhizobium sp. NBAIM08 TaxID=2793815 RepID=UPI001CD4743B|nr:hypothetical protein [Bradyrhizobium sp. NBAIM08]MCA1476768.1 hypothetical protein [Bradyrhizobium sp. NBAIM08]
MPGSPEFLAEYEAAKAGEAAPPSIGASRTLPGTVNAALVSYYQDTAFTDGLAKTTQQNRRAILETFREKSRRQAHRAAAHYGSTEHHQQKDTGSPAQLQEGNARLHRSLPLARHDQSGPASRTKAGQGEEEHRTSPMEDI